MHEFLINLFTLEVTPYSAAIKLGISFILGSVIGIERQSRRHSAGLRTFAIICIASTAATLLSIWIPQSYPYLLNGDPGRIAAQLLTGIGFLGAGAIIQSKGSVQGLTTAACILLVAIIGMCVGAGMYIPATLLTFLALFVLIILERWDRYRSMSGDTKELVMQFETVEPNIDYLKTILKNENIYIYGVRFTKDFTSNSSSYSFKIQLSPFKSIDQVIEKIRNIDGIKSIGLSEY